MQGDVTSVQYDVTSVRCRQMQGYLRSASAIVKPIMAESGGSVWCDVTNAV